jgi:excisionase family DNA binding protein
MSGNQQAPVLYTAAEAAEILKVRRSWLERQAAARKIPFTMLGGTYRFTDGHLAVIIQMHEMVPSRSGKAQDSRSRSRRGRKPPATPSGVALLSPRPRSHPPGGGITGPSAA